MFIGFKFQVVEDIRSLACKVRIILSMTYTFLSWMVYKLRWWVVDRINFLMDSDSAWSDPSQRLDVSGCRRSPIQHAKCVLYYQWHTCLSWPLIELCFHMFTPHYTTTREKPFHSFFLDSHRSFFDPAFIHDVISIKVSLRSVPAPPPTLPPFFPFPLSSHCHSPHPY